MTITGISHKAASLAIAMVLAAGILFVNPAPASADCNSTEIWIEVLGNRHDAPTNGCIGPTDWLFIVCDGGDTGSGHVVVGAEICLASPV